MHDSARPGVRPGPGPLAVACALLAWCAAVPVVRAGGGAPSAAAAPPGRAAVPHDFVVCYDRAVDLRQIEAFDLAIIDPGADLDEAEIRGATTPLLAYLSLGELAPGDPDRQRLRRLAAGENTTWQSWIMDLAAPAWRAHLVERRLPQIRARGFDGLFLDTLDAADALAAAHPERAAAYEQGLIELVRALRAAWPEARLVANRGFRVIDRLRPDLDGVLVESVFRTYDTASGEYRAVAPAESAALVARAHRLRASGLEVYVLDYVDPDARPELARATAARIRAAGFVPYVAAIDLAQVATATVAPAPRRVLALHAGNAPVESAAHQIVALPLNWLGFAVDYVDVNAAPLPPGPLAGRYRAVLLAFDRPGVRDPAALVDWLAARRSEGLRLVVLGTSGIGLLEHGASSTEVGAARARLWQLLGLRSGYELLVPQAEQELAVRDPGMMDFEAPLPGPAPLFNELESVDPRNRVHLSVRRASGGLPFDAVVTGPAGGVALAPYVIFNRPDGQDLWYVDVFAFLRGALGLGDGGSGGSGPVAGGTAGHTAGHDAAGWPAPDVTTLDGARLLLSHLDGDGFTSASEIPPHHTAGRVIRDAILARYRIPISVSLIEGEIGPAGLEPRRAPEFERLARSIFALPHIEAASHSYSHPFYWFEGPAAAAYEERFLPIPGYEFDLAREIDGSVRYVQGLLPPGKRVALFFWSGNCMPGAAAVRRVAALGIDNLNGGDTIMRGRYPSYTAVAPLTASWGGALQILAPNQNENVYTGNWSRDKWGYRNAIATFEATGSPRRVKPIDIYYHFYSGETRRSLAAVRAAYDWALAQDVAPRFASHYTRMVRDFRRARLARLDDGGWRILDYGACRTVRFDGPRPPAGRYVDLERSRGVLGFRLDQGALYVHLAPGARADVYLTGSPPARPYVAMASPRPAQVAASGGAAGERGGISLELGGLGPVTCRLAGFAPGERLRVAVGPATGARQAGKTTHAPNTGNATATVTIEQADERGRLELQLPAGQVSRVRVTAAGGRSDA